MTPPYPSHCVDRGNRSGIRAINALPLLAASYGLAQVWFGFPNRDACRHRLILHEESKHYRKRHLTKISFVVVLLKSQRRSRRPLPVQLRHARQYLNK
jgi:hypothetical protein